MEKTVKQVLIEQQLTINKICGRKHSTGLVFNKQFFKKIYRSIYEHVSTIFVLIYCVSPSDIYAYMYSHIESIRCETILEVFPLYLQPPVM